MEKALLDAGEFGRSSPRLTARQLRRAAGVFLFDAKIAGRCTDSALLMLRTRAPSVLQDCWLNLSRFFREPYLLGVLQRAQTRRGSLPSLPWRDSELIGRLRLSATSFCPLARGFTVAGFFFVRRPAHSLDYLGTKRRGVVALGGGIKTEKCSDRTDPLRQPNQELPSSSLKQIGNELWTKLGVPNAESSPAELQALLLKSERKLDGKR